MNLSGHLSGSAWLWGTGVVLQLGLLLVLVARGVARQMPLFAGLLSFCSLRAVALFVLSTRMGRPGLNVVYDGFSLMDIVLQLAVLAEMTSLLMRSHGGWTRFRVGVVAALAAWACAGAWLSQALVSLLTSGTFDRGALTLAIGFLVILVWATRAGMGGTLVREAQGLALYSGMSLVTQLERTRAAQAHNAGLLAGWSNALAVIYVAVIVFWIMTMGRRGNGVAVIDIKNWRQVAERMVS